VKDDYLREVPRDLFNEAKLLKCLGQVALLVHNGVEWPLAIEYDHGPFDVRQDPDDGGLYVENFTLWFRRMRVTLKTNYNSKAPYPLSFFDDRHGTGPVFDDTGAWSAEFREYLDRFMHFHRATTNE